MTDTDRKALQERLNLLDSLRANFGAKRDAETWGAMWDVAWRDAVRCANEILKRNATP